MSDLEKQRALALAQARRLRAQSEQRPEPQIPEGMFFNPQTGQITSRDMLKANLPTSRVGAASGGFLQGMTLGAADEIVGAIGGDFMREKARAQLEANAEDFPATEAAGQIAGAVLSPATKATGGVTTIRGAAQTGAAFGAVEGFNSGEDGALSRAQSAAFGGATGALFGGLTSAAVKGANGSVRRAFKRAEKRPSLEALKGAKNAAYAAVRKSGVEFDQNDMLALNNRVQRLAKVSDFDDIADPQSAAALRMFDARKGQGVTLNRLDKMRQVLWKRYDRSDEPLVLDLIGEIDGLIASKAEGNELMQAARLANSKFAKAQLLENAFKKARLQTAGTGSGGNILNKYRQAVTSIITKPHEAKWFSAEELAVMEGFVEGGLTENTLRRVGKLAPGGNGLMTALNVYAATVDPAMLAVTAVGTAAKEGADTTALKGSERILDAVSTGVIQRPPKPIPVGGAAVGGAIGGNSLID